MVNTDHRHAWYVTLIGAALGLWPWCGRAAAQDDAPPGSGSLLIVHAADLAEAAEDWAAYRTSTGWRVEMHAVDPPQDAGALRRRLEETLGRFAERYRPSGRVAVLLLGDADAKGIPTWRLRQDDPTLRAPGEAHYATDHPYQVLDGHGDRPQIMLGRVPAATLEQARAVLAKVKLYEQDETLGPWRRRIAYAAGEGRFGMADRLLENLFRTMVTELVPDAYDVSMTYAKPSSIYCPPPSRLRETVLSQLGDGALLFNYVGHGTAIELDSLHWGATTVPILSLADIDRLPDEHPRLAIALLTCCSAGWYDLPQGRKSLGEAMLLHPSGPVAVIAGSRPTHPYANVLLQKEITKLMLIDKVETVGELDMAAMQAMLEADLYDQQLDELAAPIALAMRWPTTLDGLRRMHVRLYNLLGDPALRIARPRQRITDFGLAGERLTGRVEGMQRGRVVVTVETERTSPARGGDLVVVNGHDDPHLERKAAHNYAIANDVVLSRIEGEVEDGRFEIPVDGDLPPGAALIKAYASGRDDTDQPLDAIGAVRLSAR
jgi:hypothetical protein